MGELLNIPYHFGSRFVLWVCAIALVLVSITIPLSIHFGRSLVFPSPPDPNAYVGYQSGPEFRGTLGIIWSCLSTIFICVYTAFHENLPRKLSPPRTVAYRMLHKVIVICFGIMAPEFMLGDAVGDLVRASDISKMYVENDPQKDGSPQTQEWTITHSFFALMGGFRDQHGSIPSLTAIFKRSHEFDNWYRQIRDKSKADPFLKLLTCLQITWFTISVIARAALKMPISLLEITTCAYVLCALISYAAWWYKPYNVTDAIVIHLDEDELEEEPREKEPTSAVALAKDQVPLQTSALAKADTLHIPEDSVDWGVAIFSFPLFGAIHLAAWNYTFDNSSAQLLWRICSIWITAWPVIKFFVEFLILAVTCCSELPVYAWTVMTVIFCIAARITLIILPFYSFICAPIGIYRITPWSSFLPSIG